MLLIVKASLLAKDTKSTLFLTRKERSGLSTLGKQRIDKGAIGNIGGELSHGYHLPADIGEDSILLCKKCCFGTNTELHVLGDFASKTRFFIDIYGHYISSVDCVNNSHALFSGTYPLAFIY